MVHTFSFRLPALRTSPCCSNRVAAFHRCTVYPQGYNVLVPAPSLTLVLYAGQIHQILAAVVVVVAGRTCWVTYLFTPVLCAFQSLRILAAVVIVVAGPTCWDTHFLTLVISAFQIRAADFFFFVVAVTPFFGTSLRIQQKWS